MNADQKQQVDPLFVQMVALVQQARAEKKFSIELTDVIRALDLADRKRVESSLQDQLNAIHDAFSSMESRLQGINSYLAALERGDFSSSEPPSSDALDTVAPVSKTGSQE